MSTAMDFHELRKVLASLSLFSSDFYKAVIENEETSLTCSPFSLFTVLSTISYGAQGITKKELTSALHSSLDDEASRKSYLSLISTLGVDEKIDLRLANQIFAAKGLDIEATFIAITKSIFQSEMQNVDFEKKTETCNIINSWCEEKTNNRIKNLIQPDHIGGKTKLVLVNAVYFKGKWKTPFDVNSTENKPFFIDDKISKHVPMMHKKARYNFNSLPELGAKYVELPYESSNENHAISMFIILPDEINGLKNVEANLHKIDFKLLHDNNSTREIILQLPKFKVESTIDLKGVLVKMGLKNMFEETDDFRGITKSCFLKVSKVIQKAFIEVDEKGSEAAAVTNIMMLRFSGVLFEAPCPVITIDRPFFCAIVATDTGITLFSTRVIDPTVL